MNALLLFIIGTDLSGLILLLLAFGTLIFFSCRFFVKRVLKSSPSKINWASIIITAGILIVCIVGLLLWSFFNFRSLDQSLGEILFDQPQPERKQKLNSVPEIIYGRYLSTSDSSYLTISENEIVLKTITNLDFSLFELDSTDRLNQKDTIYHDGNDSMSVRIKNDSVYQRSESFDTLFYSSEQYVLKEANGYYFLSKHTGSKWTVRTLRIINNELFFRPVRPKDEVEAINDHGSAQSDPVPSTSFTNEDEDFHDPKRMSEETKFIKIKN